MTIPRKTAIGLLALIGAVALLAPALLTADPLRQTLVDALLPPSAAYVLGTDHLGRSVLARLLHGAGYSLGIAACSVAVSVMIGGSLGVAAAMIGGLVGRAIGAVVNAALALPAFLVALLVAGSFAPGPLGLGIVIVATTWVEPCRVGLLTTTRGLRAAHVEAARLAGLSWSSVTGRLILPTLCGPLASLGGLMLGQAILTIASLGFLGLGLRPPTPEWGAMIADALPHAADQPLLVAIPALAIMVTVGLLFVATGPADHGPTS